MSLTVEKTTIINVDQKSFEVAQMSAEVQQMVRYFDEWRAKEANLTSDLLMAKGALRDIQNTLLETINKELAAAVERVRAAETPPAESAPAPAAAKKAVKRVAKK